MGLREVFKNAGVTITNAFGNVPVVVTYTVYGEKTYDPDTDIVTTPQTDYTGVKIFLGPFSTGERAANQNIQPTDLKGLVAANNLPGVKPSINNELTVTSASDLTIRSGDKFYVVSDFETDEAEAMFTLHLRAVT